MPPNEPSETAIAASRSVTGRSHDKPVTLTTLAHAVRIDAAYATLVEKVQNLLFDIPQFCLCLPQQEFELSERYLRKSVGELSAALAIATPRGGNDAT